LATEEGIHYMTDIRVNGYPVPVPNFNEDIKGGL
jgi:hypothetical protein